MKGLREKKKELMYRVNSVVIAGGRKRLEEGIWRINGDEKIKCKIKETKKTQVE